MLAKAKLAKAKLAKPTLTKAKLPTTTTKLAKHCLGSPRRCHHDALEETPPLDFSG